MIFDIIMKQSSLCCNTAAFCFVSAAEYISVLYGKPVEVIRSGENGIAQSGLLPLGTYWVREISTTEGFVNQVPF